MLISGIPYAAVNTDIIGKDDNVEKDPLIYIFQEKCRLLQFGKENCILLYDDAGISK
jgi:hypothetical protein